MLCYAIKGDQVDLFIILKENKALTDKFRLIVAIPLEDALGAAFVCLILDECPLPTKVSLNLPLVIHGPQCL